MDVIMDGLLIAGTLFAGVYCWVLSARVRALKSLDSGLGGAIVTLTRQIELARTTLEEARAASRESRQDLGQLVARSDAAAAQLRLLLAAIKEPETAAPPQAPAIPEAPARDAPPAEPLAARRPAPGPRLVPPPEPEAPARAQAAPLAEPDADAVPKPRRMLPLDGLLRRPLASDAPPRSEADLMAALTALAAGGER